MALGELKPSQKHNLTTFLRLVGCSVQGERLGSQDVVDNQKLFSTAFFLVSALAGMDQREKKGRNAVALKLLCLLCGRFGYHLFKQCREDKQESLQHCHEVMDLLLASSTLLERTFFPLPGRAVCRHTPSPTQETTSPDSL